MRLVVIDCENCGDKDIEKVIREGIECEYCFVIGALQSATKYRELCSNADIVQCSKVGHNAADFVLIAVLAERLSTLRYTEAIVVSNDTGYEAAIDYLNIVGYNVKQSSCSGGANIGNLRAMCGYIAKYCESGMSYSSMINKLEKQFGSGTIKSIRQLVTLGKIKVHEANKTKQIYFSKENLKEIARRGIADAI